jgi:cardiolipin synthase
VARGVACQVMIDPVGGHKWRRDTMRKLGEAGVDAREALPFHLLRGRTRRDMRNHRKLFLIDGRVGYAGSQNIVIKDFKPGITNRELVVRIEGPVVAAMAAIFLADWYCETETMLEEHPHVPAQAGETIAQVLPSGADYPLEGFETLLIWQVHEARTCVRIVTPYLIPDEDLLGALRTAVLRGVEVDLVVSAVVDQPFVNLAQCSYYDEMLAAGVRIHLFQDFLLHAKNVSFDGRLAIVGSSNVDIRSFQLNEEVSILLHDEATVGRLEAIQRDYIASSHTLDLQTWRKRSRARRFGENIARLVSPLL